MLDCRTFHKKNPSYSIIALLFIHFITHNTCLGSIVINEIHYHPVDVFVNAGADANAYVFKRSGDLYEWIEIHNAGDLLVDISGWNFTKGIQYSFPHHTSISPDQYLVIVRNITYGPSSIHQYTGMLSNNGEQITLVNDVGEIVDSVKYKTKSPWPETPDGYNSLGHSLERISWDLPPSSPFSWLPGPKYGTPGAKNMQSSSLNRLRPRPVDVSKIPKHPNSTQSVEIRVQFHINVSKVNLQWEIAGSSGQPITKSMFQESGNIYKVSIPPQSSQSLVRFNFICNMIDNRKFRVPHINSIRPYSSYFVYDNEITTKLPLAWIFLNDQTLTNPPKKTSGLVIKDIGESKIKLFDGAIISISVKANYKVHFLKSDRWKGYGELKISQEASVHEGSGGVAGPILEEFGFWLFREQGVNIVPISEKGASMWRVVWGKTDHRHNFVIPDMENEVIKDNKREQNGDLWKANWRPNYPSHPEWPTNYEKRSNLEERIRGIYELVDEISNCNNLQDLSSILRTDTFVYFSVISVLISNWDGFFNNHWLYYDINFKKWEFIPWDLDKTFGLNLQEFKLDDAVTYLDHSLKDLPISWPWEGQWTQSDDNELATRETRPPGRVHSELHKICEFQSQYLDVLENLMDTSFRFNDLRLKIDELENRLLEDINLAEQYTGKSRASYQQKVITVYQGLKNYLMGRYTWLLKDRNNNWANVRSTTTDVKMGNCRHVDASPLPPVKDFPVKLNEAVAKGGVDWVEIINPSSNSINLGGMILADRNPPRKLADDQFIIPNNAESVLEAREYRVIKLPKNGLGLGSSDSLFLFDAWGRLLDETSWESGQAPEGKSWGKCENDIWKTNFLPTPGSRNDCSDCKTDKITGLSLTEVSMEEKGWVEIYNENSEVISLDGLSLMNSLEHRYVFPEHLTISGKSFFVVMLEENHLKLASVGYIKFYDHCDQIIDQIKWDQGDLEIGKSLCYYNSNWVTSLGTTKGHSNHCMGVWKEGVCPIDCGWSLSMLSEHDICISVTGKKNDDPLECDSKTKPNSTKICPATRACASSGTDPTIYIVAGIVILAFCLGMVYFFIRKRNTKSKYKTRPHAKSEMVPYMKVTSTETLKTPLLDQENEEEYEVQQIKQIQRIQQIQQEREQKKFEEQKAIEQRKEHMQREEQLKQKEREQKRKEREQKKRKG